MQRIAFPLRVVWISLWLQYKLLYLEGLIMSVLLPPLAHTLFMVLLIRHLGRPELAPYAILGAAFLGAWSAAVNSAGAAIAEDRWTGTLELVFTSPAGAWLVMFGRVLFTSVLALVAVAETAIIGGLMGLQLDVRDPVLLIVALVASLGSLAAAGLVAASTFVLSGNMRLFTNLMVFPLVILSGAAFPVDVLPQVIRPVSEIISLKWGAELLRASVGAGDVNVSLALTVMGLLTVAYIALGRAVFQVVDRRVRADGSLSSDE